jgi:hypothetical protein
MKAFLTVLALLVLAIPACRAGPDSSLLSITNGQGARHDFHVEIAATPEARTMGLMFRKSLDPDAGMLFVFDDEQPRQFWMKNTLIPLDMIFIGSGGVIRYIHANAIPHDETPVPAEGIPAIGVLEINGGRATALGLKSGDVVHHLSFSNMLADSASIH